MFNQHKWSTDQNTGYIYLFKVFSLLFPYYYLATFQSITEDTKTNNYCIWNSEQRAIQRYTLLKD